MTLHRREFITLLGGAAAWPLTAHAQQAIPVIGWLSSRDLETDVFFFLPAFRQGLNETGYIDGQNVVIDFADSHYDKLPHWHRISLAGPST